MSMNDKKICVAKVLVEECLSHEDIAEKFGLSQKEILKWFSDPEFNAYVTRLRQNYMDSEMGDIYALAQTLDEKIDNLQRVVLSIT